MPRESNPRTALNITKLIRRIERPKPKVDDERRIAIMEILLAKDAITRAEIIEMFELHPGSVSLLIGCMVEEGLIERIKWGLYVPGEFFANFWESDAS